MIARKDFMLRQIEILGTRIAELFAAKGKNDTEAMLDAFRKSLETVEIDPEASDSDWEAALERIPDKRVLFQLREAAAVCASVTGDAGANRLNELLRRRLESTQTYLFSDFSEEVR